MVFSSWIFIFVFLPVTCLVYYIIPHKCRNLWLLVSSLFFYAWNIPAFALILISSVIVNWAVGIMLSHFECRKIILTIGVIVNILILGYFKYANFIVYNIGIFKPEIYEKWNTITLPLGISFFTFQGMSYIIDVYRGDGDAIRNPLDLAIYISFFPQLVAGPIVRYTDIMTDLLGERQTDLQCLGKGFRRFVYGLSKKMVLANTFGQIADNVFNDTTIWNNGSTWIGIIAYTLQIYYDFSGYSDMAIGLGNIFGFHFTENFNYPYSSKSVTEFWRRWHISLSSWFRDYVYIPLGGNRVDPKRHIFNILVVWMLTGMWHGANWTFLLWGLYYGIILIIEKYIIKGRFNRAPRVFRWLITMIIVMTGWVAFRSESVGQTFLYLKNMFVTLPSKSGYDYFVRILYNYRWFFVVGLIAMFPQKDNLKRILQIKYVEKMNIAVVENIYICILFCISLLYLIAGNYNAFIYFQF